MNDTPATDAEAFDLHELGWRQHTPDGAYVDADFARELERELNDLKRSIADLSHPNCQMLMQERDDAIVEATNAVNDIIRVRYQRDRLAEALKEMRWAHTDKAERMAIDALSYLENDQVDATGLRRSLGTVADGAPRTCGD